MKYINVISMLLSVNSPDICLCIPVRIATLQYMRYILFAQNISVPPPPP